MQNSTRNNPKKQTLVEEKSLEFVDIAPTWKRRFSEFPVSLPKRIKWFLDMHQPEICVVGEAYGFTGDYKQNCFDCKEFSLMFEDYYIKNNLDNLHKVKDDFVEHWNLFHKQVTYSLIGARRQLRWYDSFLRFDDYIWTLNYHKA